MLQSARMIAVTSRDMGASLAADHAAGQAVLSVDSVAAFDETGGTVLLVADAGEGTQAEYVSVDHDSSTIVLATPLADDWSASTAVQTYPKVSLKVALVLLGDDPATVGALVPPEVGSHPLMVDGIVDGDPVAVTVRDEAVAGYSLVVQSLVGYEPGVASTALVGPAPDGWGGGPADPPTDAPTITAAPHSVGTVRVTITPLDPSLQSRYEIAVSLTSPVPEDGSATIGTTFNTSYDIATLNGTQIPFDAPTYVKVRAVNDLGEGPWSAEASAIPRQADNEFISALFAYLGSIEANQVTTGEFTADLALIAKLAVGNRIELSGAPGNTHMTIYAAELDDDGNKIPLIELKPEGSTFRGRIVADDVSVLNGLVLQGVLSQISAGGGVTIMAGVGDPIAPPSAVPALSTSPFPAVPAGFVDRGLSWDDVDGQWLRLLVSTASDIAGKCRVQKISATTGLVTATVTLANVTGIGENDMSGVCRVGSSLFVMVFDDHFDDYWAPVQFNATTGAVIQNAGPHTVFTSKNRPAICKLDETAILMACCEAAGLHIIQWEITDWSVAGYDMSSIPIWRDLDTAVRELEWPSGATDLTAVRWSPSRTELTLVGAGKMRIYDTVDSVDYFGYEATLAPAKGMDMQASGGGASHRPLVGWHSEHSGTSLYRYSPYRRVAGDLVHATYANTAGGNTTLDSPPASVAVPTGRFLSLSLGAAPSGVTGADVFLGIGSSVPADSSLNKRNETLTSQRTLLVDLALAGDTTKHPPTVSSFSPGGSGWLKSALGGIELRGDGQGDWPWLRTHAPIAGTWQLTTPFVAVNPSESTIGGYALSTVDSNPEINDYLSLNVGTGDGLWTVLVDGFYRIDTRVSWPANSSGHRYLRPRIDSTNVDSVSMGPGNGGNISLGHVIPIRWLTAGQTFRVRQMQNSGSDLTIAASSSAGQTFVHIQYLGRAA